MVEKATRTRERSSRSTTERQWELFVRSEADDPLRHVGTIAAPDPDTAHEEASKLFAWYARDVWICPADETHRYSTSTLADGGTSHSDRTAEHSIGSDDDNSIESTTDETTPEPRVYEETEGTPDLRDASGDAESRDTEEKTDSTNR